MGSVTQQQNGGIKKNTKNLQEELDKRMDQKFDKQERHMKKTLDMFTTTIMNRYTQTRSRNPTRIEPQPSKEQRVKSTTLAFYLPSNDKSINDDNTNGLLFNTLDVPMENNLPPDPNKLQQE